MDSIYDCDGLISPLYGLIAAMLTAIAEMMASAIDRSANVEGPAPGLESIQFLAMIQVNPAVNTFEDKSAYRPNMFRFC